MRWQRFLNIYILYFEGGHYFLSGDLDPYKDLLGDVPACAPLVCVDVMPANPVAGWAQ